ncbi:hypothetical protein [Pedobacter arcticus]|uniref:hypothetical protein n=1 Tax=Pedobacter arcticus TaxID=752140 RepID=UPI0002EDACF0|nr:hypothetical protein [Pedobacter arcticus]
MESTSTVIKQNRGLYKIVTTHYLVAGFTFLALIPMLFFSAQDFGSHYFQPHLLAITHAVALGWASMIVIGLCYQLVPLLLKAELYSYKLAWFALVAFYLGLIDLVYSFWVFEPGLHMQCGSLLLLVGISSFAINITLTAKAIKKPDIHQDFLLTSSIWLLFTAILGVLMVFNFRYAFLPKDHLLFLKIHAHSGIVGWFLLLVIGLSTKLLPLFSFKAKGNVVLLKWSYYLLNFSLIVFFVNTYIFDLNTATYLIALVALSGIVCWLLYVYQCAKACGSLKIDASILHILLAGLLLSGAIFLLPFIIFYQLKADALAIRLTTIYGSLLLLGWINSLLLGQTFKTFPYILGGQKDLSLGIKLYNSKALNLQFLSFLIFITSFSLGLAFSIKWLVYFGITCFSATAVLYISNIFIVLFKIKKNEINSVL